MPPFQIDEDQIRRLALLLEETGLTEIEFAEGELRLRLTRMTAAVVSAPGPMMVPQPATLPAAVSAPPGPPAGALVSPMVGTVYLAPDPSSPPFARSGDRVVEGQTLLIIEAMKVMNPIRAPRSGTVTAVLVQDAQPVEYGEPLMIID